MNNRSSTYPDMNNRSSTYNDSHNRLSSYLGPDSEPPPYEDVTILDDVDINPTSSTEGAAGTIYTPGNYPTPELLPYPTGRYRTLDQTRYFTSVTIQAALDELGEYSTLYLPQRSRWAVSRAIVLHPHQELATWGYPKDEKCMALLKAESMCKPHILDCSGRKGTRLRNLKLDGGREKFGYDEACRSMVALGCEGAQDQVMDRCVLKHPRNSGCCHAYGEGAQTIRITNNLIGPAGYHKQLEPGDQRADGITCAANNGLIAGNYIVDITYAGIALCGASGMLVTSNTVVTKNRIGVVGIHMRYHSQNAGNHEWTRVVHNTIRLKGSYLKIGIAQGSQILSSADSRSTERVIRGGTVMYNLIESKPTNDQNPGTIGFGYVVSRVENWTCTENVSAHNLIYEGKYTAASRNMGLPVIRPMPFIKSSSSDSGEQASRPSRFQDDFCEGSVVALARIKPV